MKGTLPGDRIILLASKRENTKVGVSLDKGKLTGTRETASGDDVMRECLTEYDRNLETLAGVVHRVACRADNHTIEMKVDSLLATAGKNGLTISLDVSGWSPTGSERLRWSFVICSSTSAMKVSRVFKDVSAVTSRDGFHNKWMTTDGSIQGFFGSADTILHSMMGQFALAQFKENNLVSKKSKVQKITLIDDIIMAISEAPRNRQRILDFINEVYQNLGFQPDIVKTLMTTIKGHFLNRLYSGHFEVLAANKIFGKADREWERSMSTAWDRINIVMGAFRGASETGANPVLCYVTAIWRAMTLIYQIGGKGYKPDTAVTAVFAWLTPALGGYGIPNFTHWTSRSTENPLTAGLGTVCRIARTIRYTMPKLYTIIQDCLNYVVSSQTASRSSVAIADDPFGVRLSAVKGHPLHFYPRRWANKSCVHDLRPRDFILPPDSERARRAFHGREFYWRNWKCYEFNRILLGLSVILFCYYFSLVLRYYYSEMSEMILNEWICWDSLI